MHIFNITTIKHTTAEAILLATNNPYINGNIVGKNAYRSQEVLTVKAEYQLDIAAIKAEITEGKTYEVTGSWIRGVLHLTSAKEIELGHYFIDETGYNCMRPASM